jgi:hypothetical protein
MSLQLAVWVDGSVLRVWVAARRLTVTVRTSTFEPGSVGSMVAVKTRL